MYLLDQLLYDVPLVPSCSSSSSVRFYVLVWSSACFCGGENNRNQMNQPCSTKFYCLIDLPYPTLCHKRHSPIPCLLYQHHHFTISAVSHVSAPWHGHACGSEFQSLKVQVLKKDTSNGTPIWSSTTVLTTVKWDCVPHFFGKNCPIWH